MSEWDEDAEHYWTAQMSFLCANPAPAGYSTFTLADSEEGTVMPASPTRTKKALQELARVFNKLASELTADLNAAINEIEGLKREVQRLKSGSGKTRKTSTFQKKSAPSKTSRPHTTKGSQQTTHASHHESGHGAKPSNETGSFVFPHEPFNPTPPPEPTPPGNN